MSEQKRLESGCGAVLQGMAGKKVCVELRGSNYAMGILESCNSDLNIRLRDVTVIQNSQKQQHDEYFVLGKHVRFVHFEHYVHVPAAIRRCQKGVTADRPEKSRMPNRRLDQKQFDTGKKVLDE